MPRNANQSKQSNYSIDFEGADYIDCGDDNMFSFVNGTTDSPFSVSFWTKLNSVTGTQPFLSKDITSPNREWAISIFSDSSNGVRIFLKNQGGDSQQSIDSSTALTTGVWYHITTTYDGRGGSDAADGLSIYINGSLDTPTNIAKATYTAMSNTTAPVYIGKYSTNEINGKITEVSIFDYALSASQVTTLWGGGTSVSNPMALPSPPIAYYPLGTSAYNGEYLAENNAIGDYIFDFIPNDYIDCGDVPLEGVYTISFWINPDATPSDLYFLFDKRDGISTNISARVTQSSNNTIRFQIGTTNFSSTDTLTNNSWNNVILIANGSSSKIYINNGTATTGTLATAPNTTGSFFIGTDNAQQSAYFFNGQMSNIQIFNTALSSAEVTTLYNYGSPIQTLANIPQSSNLKAWYKLDATEIYNSTTTEWSIDNNQNPSAYPSSLNFDSASSDRIDTGAKILNNMTSYTASIWAKGWSTSTLTAIMSQYDGGSVSPLILTARHSSNTNGFTAWLTLGGTFYTSHNDEGFSDNTKWVNLTVTWNGSDLILYVNGIAGDVTSASGTIDNSTTYNFHIGGYSNVTSNSYNGQLSNCSIWNAALTSTQVTELYNNGTPSNLSSHSVTSNLVSWYKLNNTTTGIEDSKGSNNGTNNGATEYAGFVNKLVGDSSGMTQANLVQSNLQTVAPYSKYAMDFDGSNDYIGVTTSSITGNSARSMSFWYKTTSSSAMIPFSIGNPSSFGVANSQFAYCINNGSTTQAAVFAIATNDVTPITGVPATNDGNWHNVVVSWSGSVLSLHIDGASYSTPQPAGNYNTTAGFKMGGWGNNDRKFNGQLSSCSVWNTALTSAQITELYNQGLPSNLNNHSAYSNLVSWWQLGENSSFDGNDWIVADEKGSNNGTSVSMPVGALVNGVGTTANGVSSGMSEGNLVGDAPYSTANALSTNMVITSRVSGVSDAAITTGGTGYVTGTNIATTGGSGTNCTINITTVSGGVITAITINNGGSNYVIGDVLTISGGNGNATITVSGLNTP